MTNKDTVNNYQNPANNLLLTKSAFTLAETLIVMGIIGVVAALTLPNLNSSTGDKEKVVKLKKIYSNLQDAFGRVEAVYGPIDEWEWRCDSNSMSECHVYKFVNRMSDFTKVSFPLDYHYLPNGVFGGHNSGRNDTMPVFADGSAMSFSPERGGGGLIGRIVAYVDIDGINKGASKLGSDVFEIIVYDGDNGTKMVPAGLGSTDQQLTDNCFKKGENCAAWVIQNGNMDYLKATNGKCSGSNIQLSWTNTTCK